MTTIEALILGIVQGLTEFLPISSSGHLLLIQDWLRLKNAENSLFFNLICHLGTLLAICLLLFQPLCALFHSDQTRFKQILLATLPLFPLVLILKPIKAAYADLNLLGSCFLLTALILFVGVKWGTIASETQRMRHQWRDALSIGCWQALAILPGISRSGATISGARLLGWAPQEAVVFSFLLAIPATLGGIVLESYQLIKNPAALDALAVWPYCVGFGASFLTGLCTFQLLLRWVYQKFSYFAWYCLILGLAVTALYQL